MIHVKLFPWNRRAFAGVGDTMKSILLLVIGSTAVVAQPLSVGVKGGIPFTDFIETVSGNQAIISSSNNRYIVGPFVELRLPAGFSVELDALYRRFSFNASTTLAGVFSNARTTGNAWEFPLLVKKKFSNETVRPFLDAGVSFDKISGLTQTVQSVANISGSAEKKDFTTGFVVGAGLELRLLLLKVSPEIRYTRWGSQHFSQIFAPGALLNSNQNQAEFLIGISF